jgi:hypothetical protein
MVVCACIGIAVMVGVEKISVTDAIYWSIVTGTTVGYGDISPQEPATRLFALVYLFAAIVTTGKALSAVGDLLSVEDNTADTLLHKKLGKKGEAGVVAGGVGVPFFGTCCCSCTSWWRVQFRRLSSWSVTDALCCVFFL